MVVKEKVSQNIQQISQNEQKNSMNYTKQREELKRLLDEHFNSTSGGLSDISSYRQGLTINSVLVGQTKYNATIHLGTQPTMSFNVVQ